MNRLRAIYLRRCRDWLLLLVVGMILLGCGGDKIETTLIGVPTETPFFQSSPSPNVFNPPVGITSTSKPIKTPLPSATPTQGGILTVTPLQPTPALENSLVGKDILFSHVEDSTCRLPCWQGLRLGISTRYDVQDTFDKVFHFGGKQDFFNPVPFGKIGKSLLDPLDFSNLYYTGYLWEPQANTFGLVAWLSTDTDTLYAMKFYWSDYPALTPSIQQIVKHLGTPSEVLISATGTETSFTIIDIAVIYEAGITFTSRVGSQIRTTNQNGVAVDTAEICLNRPATVTLAYLTDSYANGLTNLPPLLDRTVGVFISRGQGLKSIKDALNLTTEQFAAIALREDDPCIILH